MKESESRPASSLSSRVLVMIPGLAHDLFRARRNWFDAEDKDDITRSLIEEVFRLDDRGLARVWVEEIIDPELRRDLRKQIDNPRQRFFLFLRRQRVVVNSVFGHGVATGP